MPVPTIGPTIRFFERRLSMERFLLLWDEIDDLMGTSRYYVKNTAMAIWTTVRQR